MTSVVVKGSSSISSYQVPAPMSAQEKGSRNKRKFRADPSLVEPNNIIHSPLNECPTYEFTDEKFDITSGHGHNGACDLCGVSQDHSDGLKLDLGQSSSIGSSEVGPSRTREESEVEESQDADWNDLTESQLEELVLSNLDAIFKSAIKKIIACNYTEEVATKAVLRSGLCYGCKDTVSNIVDNTLAFLRIGQDINTFSEHYFEDLRQLEKYTLAEFVCVLHEVRPLFSNGDALWCLLICDMNMSHAYAMDGGTLSGFPGDDGASNGNSHTTSQPQLKTEGENSELNHPNPCKPVPSIPRSHSSQSEAPSSSGIPNITNSKNSLVGGRISEKAGTYFMSDDVDKTFSAVRASQSPASKEKFVGSRKVHSGGTKREYMLYQKSFHLSKHYQTYGSKGSSRAGKLSGGLGGLIFDNKLKSESETTSVNIKNSSLKISKAIEAHQDNWSHNLSISAGPSVPAAFNAQTANAIFSKTYIPTLCPPVSAPTILPLANTAVLSAADTDLSISLPPKSNTTQVRASINSEAPTCGYAGIPYDKSLEQLVVTDERDEIILKLILRVRELHNQLHEWNEWVNLKVMQAARRLSKDKAELKTLRQEKEEVERLKKEKKILEENTTKKLSEMENALCKASGQVEQANSAVRRLEVENVALRQQMEAAKVRAAKSSASCQEVSKREKRTQMKFQSWEKQKTIFQEVLVTEKCKVAQMLLEWEQAKVLLEQLEARWQQEKKAKEELLMQASSIRKEREQIEASVKSKEDLIKSKAETNLTRYKDDIQRIEKEISQLRLKTNSSKIAALRRGIDGSYAGRFTEIINGSVHKESQTPLISEVVKDLRDFSGMMMGGVKRERECVMCLSEEMSVVFLPCAHQVVCATCNELHEKQGMEECPSCRSPIQRRILVHYARS